MAKKATPKEKTAIPKGEATVVAPPSFSAIASFDRAAIRWLLQQERIRADRPGHTGNPLECGLHLENLS